MCCCPCSRCGVLSLHQRRGEHDRKQQRTQPRRRCERGICRRELVGVSRGIGGCLYRFFCVKRRTVSCPWQSTSPLRWRPALVKVCPRDLLMVMAQHKHTRNWKRWYITPRDPTSTSKYVRGILTIGISCDYNFCIDNALRKSSDNLFFPVD